MNLPISPEIREALDSQKGPLLFTDQERQKSYVLLPIEAFDKIKGLMDDSDFSVSDFYPTMVEATRAAWDAPGMELYDNYDTNRAKL